MAPPYLTKTSDGFILSIRVEPRSSKTEIVGSYNDRLKIKIKSAPVEGKANKELIALLASEFKLKKSDITVISGLKSKDKTVRIKTDQSTLQI